jgi:LDH2 family malate/lactate/ureidoglycolate dehydrogenase
MGVESENTRRYSAGELTSFIERCLLALDLPAADAEIVADLMIEADLNGTDSHGIFRLPQYVQRIRDGGFNIRPKVRIERENAATALVDGDNAMGHLAMNFATRVAMEKAKTHGIGWVGVHHSNHAGPAALYAKIPLQEDMIGLYIAVGSSNHLPPWGGTELLLGTNPIAIAIPALEEAPIVLDMATSVSAFGKVRTHAQRGEPMPEGWMIDREGKPLTDAARAAEGFLLPIGGYKGYGLALIFGLLAGTLNGAAFGKDVIDFTADTGSVTNTGQLIAAISIEAFMPVQAFKHQVDIVIRDMQGSATLPGYERVRVPGEGSAAARRERSRAGIALHPNLLGKLNNLAGELGVAALS